MPITLDDLYEKVEGLEEAIADAAERDDGDAWEDLNDQLEEIQEEIERHEPSR